MLRNDQLPTFQGVVAGQTAICELNLGRRLNSIILEVGDADGTVAYAKDGNGNIVDALISQIRVKLNGKPQRTMSLGELCEINSVNGAQYGVRTSGTPGDPDYRTYAQIYFAEPWRKVPTEEKVGAWNLAGIESCQVEVDIKEGVNSPVVRGIFDFDPLTGTIGRITKWIRQSFEAVGTEQDIQTIDRKIGEFIQAIHAFPSTDGKYINRYRVTAAGENIRDLIYTLQNQAILLGYDLNPDVSDIPRLDIVFDYDDRLNSALPLSVNGVRIPDLTFHIEWSASANGNLPTIIERFGPPE